MHVLYQGHFCPNLLRRTIFLLCKRSPDFCAFFQGFCLKTSIRDSKLGCLLPLDDMSGLVFTVRNRVSGHLNLTEPVQSSPTTNNGANANACTGRNNGFLRRSTVARSGHPARRNRSVRLATSLHQVRPRLGSGTHSPRHRRHASQGHASCCAPQIGSAHFGSRRTSVLRPAKQGCVQVVRPLPASQGSSVEHRWRSLRRLTHLGTRQDEP